MDSKNPILKRYEPTSTKAPSPYPPTAATATGASGAAGTGDFDAIVAGSGARITLNDVVVKSAILFAITVVFAFVGWQLAWVSPFIWVIGSLAMLGLGIANSVMKRINVALVIAYAIVTGIVLGGISNWYNAYAEASQYNGLVLQAVIGTMTAFGVMLILYMTNIVKVTGKFVRVLIASMFAYLLIGLASFIAALFGVGGGWGFYGVSGIGLLLCLAGVALAAFTLMLDFESIKQGIAAGVPERESWRMGFGLLVTLVWLYLEILRMLALVVGRN